MHERVDPMSLAGGGEAAESRRRLTSFVASKEQPVVPAHYGCTQSSFGNVMPTAGLCRVVVSGLGFECDSRIFPLVDAA